MAHKCEYKTSLSKKGNDIEMTITAHWRGNSVEVIKAKLFHEDIKVYVGLQFSMFGGYLVSFPNEVMSVGYYSKDKVGDLEKQYYDMKFKNIPNLAYDSVSSESLNWLKTQLPQDKFIIEKAFKHENCYPVDLFKVLKLYHSLSKSDQSLCEYLFEHNLPKMAMNKSLYKLSKKKRVELFQFVQSLENVPDNLQVIQWAMKSNLTDFNIYYLLKQYAFLGLTFNEAEYLCKLEKQYPNDSGIRNTYLDYLQMVKNEPTANIKDKYWYAPKDFEKMNERLKTLAEERKELELVNLSKKMKKQLYKFKINPKAYNDYVIYISTDMKEWKTQAEALHQCIITCKYYDKVIEGKSLVFFIKKNNEPYGTFEIDYKKKILQAYGNEQDRKNCTIPNEIMKYVNDYVKGLNLQNE